LIHAIPSLLPGIKPAANGTAAEQSRYPPSAFFVISDKFPSSYLLFLINFLFALDFPNMMIYYGIFPIKFSFILPCFIIFPQFQGGYAL